PFLLSCTSFIHSCGPIRHRHSFPTRRSSDLSSASLAPTHSRLSAGVVLHGYTGLWLSLPSLPAAVTKSTSGWRDMTSANASFRRSEEHTSELQSRSGLVCRVLLEKKNCDNSS